jgi:hypothetical protein
MRLVPKPRSRTNLSKTRSTRRNTRLFWAIIKLYSSSFNPIFNSLNNKYLTLHPGTGITKGFLSKSTAQIKILKNNSSNDPLSPTELTVKKGSATLLHSTDTNMISTHSAEKSKPIRVGNRAVVSSQERVKKNKVDQIVASNVSIIKQFAVASEKSSALAQSPVEKKTLGIEAAKWNNKPSLNKVAKATKTAKAKHNSQVVSASALARPTLSQHIPVSSSLLQLLLLLPYESSKKGLGVLNAKIKTIPHTDKSKANSVVQISSNNSNFANYINSPYFTDDQRFLFLYFIIPIFFATLKNSIAGVHSSAQHSVAAHSSFSENKVSVVVQKEKLAKTKAKESHALSKSTLLVSSISAPRTEQSLHTFNSPVHKRAGLVIKDGRRVNKRTQKNLINQSKQLRALIKLILNSRYVLMRSRQRIRRNRALQSYAFIRNQKNKINATHRYATKSIKGILPATAITVRKEISRGTGISAAIKVQKANKASGKKPVDLNSKKVLAQPQLPTLTTSLSSVLRSRQKKLMLPQFSEAYLVKNFANQGVDGIVRSSTDLLKNSIYFIAQSLVHLKRKDKFNSLIFFNILKTRGFLDLKKKFKFKASRLLQERKSKGFAAKRVITTTTNQAALQLSKSAGKLPLQKKNSGHPSSILTNAAIQTQQYLPTLRNQRTSTNRAKEESHTTKVVQLFHNSISSERAVHSKQLVLQSKNKINLLKKSRVKPTGGTTATKLDGQEHGLPTGNSPHTNKIPLITFYPGGRYISDWKRVEKVIWQEEYKFNAIYKRAKNSLNFTKINIKKKLKNKYTIFTILKLWNIMKIKKIKLWNIMKIKKIKSVASFKLQVFFIKYGYASTGISTKLGTSNTLPHYGYRYGNSNATGMQQSSGWYAGIHQSTSTKPFSLLAGKLIQRINLADRTQLLKGKTLSNLFTLRHILTPNKKKNIVMVPETLPGYHKKTKKGNNLYTGLNSNSGAIVQTLTKSKQQSSRNSAIKILGIILKKKKRTAAMLRLLRIDELTLTKELYMWGSEETQVNFLENLKYLIIKLILNVLDTMHINNRAKLLSIRPRSLIKPANIDSLLYENGDSYLFKKSKDFIEKLVVQQFSFLFYNNFLPWIKLNIFFKHRKAINVINLNKKLTRLIEYIDSLSSLFFSIPILTLDTFKKLRILSKNISLTVADCPASAITQTRLFERRGRVTRQRNTEANSLLLLLSTLTSPYGIKEKKKNKIKGMRTATSPRLISPELRISTIRKILRLRGFDYLPITAEQNKQQLKNYVAIGKAIKKITSQHSRQKYWLRLLRSCLFSRTGTSTALFLPFLVPNRMFNEKAVLRLHQRRHRKKKRGKKAKLQNRGIPPAQAIKNFTPTTSIAPITPIRSIEFYKSYNNLVNAKLTIIGKIRSIKLIELLDKIKEANIRAEELAALKRVADITNLNIINKKKSRNINSSKYLIKKNILLSNRIKILHTIKTIKTDFIFEPKLDSNALSRIPVSLLYYSNLQPIVNSGSTLLRNNSTDSFADTQQKIETEKPPVISSFLRELSIYNRETKGIINYFSKIISYNFNANNNKISSSITDLLEASFKVMHCLISKPVFVITPEKVTIQLFYFLMVANKKQLKKIRKRSRFNNKKQRIYNIYKKKRLIEAKNLNLYNLNEVFSEQFELLCGRLNKIFNKPVELNLIRLHYPSEDSNILVNFMDILINKVFLARIYKKIFRGTIIKSLITFKKRKYNNISIIPAFLTGLNIKIAGRIMTQKVRPRKTINLKHRGATASGKINYLNFARLTNKNKRGSYSITVSAGQNYFK